MMSGSGASGSHQRSDGDDKEAAGGGHSEDQETRSRLRTEFLRALDRLSGRGCDVVLHSGFVSAGSVLLATDRDVARFVLRDLGTPTGTVPQALLRTTDVDSVSFK